jgi:hypothetical protein
MWCLYMDYGEKINLCFRGVHSAKFNYVLLSFRNCSFSEHRHNQGLVYSQFYQSDYPYRLSNLVYICISLFVCIDIAKYFATFLRDSFSEQPLPLHLHYALEILKRFQRVPVRSAIIRPYVPKRIYLFFYDSANIQIFVTSFVDVVMV